MRKLPQFLVYTPFLAVVDLLLIHAAFITLFLFNYGWHGMDVPKFIGYVHIIPGICVVCILTLYVGNLYTSWLARATHQIVYFVWVSVCIIVLGTMAISSWERVYIFPRRIIVGTALLQFLLLTAYRLSIRHLFWKLRGKRRVMVVAPNAEKAVNLVRKLQCSLPSWMQLVGYMVSPDAAEIVSRASEFDTVMLPPLHPEIRLLIKTCASIGKQIMFVPSVMEMSLLGASQVSINDVLFFEVQHPSLSPGQSLMKRAFDLAVSLVLLVLTSPLFLITSLLILFTSKGPIFFKQDRVGQNGVEFTLYKFRTMVANAEKETGPVLAQVSDPRITRLGSFLRSTRIDELPQLFNVLMGDMSLVGPRPERKFFVEQFQKTVTGYDFRFAVKPGITGFAQVSGSYATTVERKLRFDLFYIYNFSILLDIRICMRTLLVMLHKEQAEGINVEELPAIRPLHVPAE